MGKKKTRVLPVIIVLLVSVFFLGAGCAGGNQARVKELEQEVATIRAEKEALQGQITALETEVADLR